MKVFPKPFETYEQWAAYEGLSIERAALDMTMFDDFIGRVERRTETVSYLHQTRIRKRWLHLRRCDVIEYQDGSVWIIGHPKDIYSLLW